MYTIFLNLHTKLSQLSWRHVRPLTDNSGEAERSIEKSAIWKNELAKPEHARRQANARKNKAPSPDIRPYHWDWVEASLSKSQQAAQVMATNSRQVE